MNMSFSCMYLQTKYFFRTFTGKTPYDLSRKKQSLHCFFQRFISNFLNENETMHSPTSFTETNFCQKSLSSNMSQLSVESNKSSDPVYDVPSRDTGTDSPSKSNADKGSIYNLLWPQPKAVIELKNFTAPFIAGKELFISIIQVRKDIYISFFRNFNLLNLYFVGIFCNFILYLISYCAYNLFPREVSLYIKY